MRQQFLLNLLAGAVAVYADPEPEESDNGNGISIATSVVTQYPRTPADTMFAPPVINIELACDAQPPVIITVTAFPTENVAFGTGVAGVNGNSHGEPTGPEVTVAPAGYSATSQGAGKAGSSPAVSAAFGTSSSIGLPPGVTSTIPGISQASVGDSTATSSVGGVVISNPAQAVSSGAGAESGVASEGGSVTYSTGVSEPSIVSSASFSSAGTIQTLQPAVPWTQNTANFTSLVPVNSTEIYFTANGVADPTLEHLFALLTSNNTYPSVVLEHSAFIQNVSCVDQGLQLLFSTVESAAFAQSVWNETFIVITSSAGCGSADSGQHTYWMVSAVTFTNATTAILQSVEMAIEDALEDVHVAWGTYSPANGTATASFSSTMPSATASSASCGSPPAATISGFPAAACGDDFDQVLDDELGYYDFSDDFSSDLEDVAPGLGDYNDDDYQTDDIEYYNSTTRRRALGHASRARSTVRIEKRALSIKPFFQKVGSVAKSVVSATGSGLKFVASKYVSLGTKVIKVATGQESFSDAFTSTSINTNINIDVGPKNLVDSKYWGQAFQIFHGMKENKAKTAQGSIDLYCVGCGITGNAHIAGSLAFSVTSLSITKGNIAVDGNLRAALNLGLAAQAEYKDNFKTQIIAAPIPPGLTIPKVITVGPSISLNARLDIDIQAEGQIYAGAVATLPAFHASLDVVNSGGSSVSGFSPNFETTFTANGEISAAVRLGLPISIGIGLSVPLIKFDKTIALSNEPYIQGTAAYAYSTNPNPPACNNGVNFGFGLGDAVYMDFFGSKTLSLFDYAAPPVTTCVSLAAKAPTTVAAISSSSTDSSSSISSSGTDSTSALASSTNSAVVPAVSSSQSDTAVPATSSTSATDMAPYATDASVLGTSTMVPAAVDTVNTVPVTTDTPSIVPAAVDTLTTAPVAMDSTAPVATDTATSDPVAADTPSSPANLDTATIQTPTAGTDAASTDTSSPDAQPPSRRHAAIKRAMDIMNRRQDSSTDNPTTTTTDDEPSVSDLGPADFGDDAFANYTTISDLSDDVIDADESNSTITDDEGFTYAPIQDSSGQYYLTADSSGTIRLDDTDDGYSGDDWSYYLGSVVSDQDDRILHYYPDTMSAFGVSRFRVSDESQFPKGADILTLTTINTDDSDETPNVLLPVDTKGNVFYTVVCDIDDDNKVFLVNDTETGVSVLEREDLRFIITGGVVQDCDVVAFNATMGVPDGF